MSSDDSGRQRFTTVIDLTAKAQQTARQDRVVSSFSEPDPPLPDITIDELPPTIRKAVDTAGWDSLMAVQEKAIPYALEGRDLIVQSRTGSGKTGAFLLPLFDKIDPTIPETQALILCPTRELARQIHEEFTKMAGGEATEDGLRAALVYGGVRYKSQLSAFKQGAHVVIGTPGRIIDHLYRKSFSLHKLEALIFDEADEMLSMGFLPAMREMKKFLPRKRQSLMFSATMPPRVRTLAEEFLNEPGFLSLSVGQVSVDAIDHRYYQVDQMDKDRTLVKLFEMESPESAIIFVNTKRDVEYLAKFLRNYGFDASEISGDLDQKARERVMDRIRKGELRFLVATDVAARGIDISDLSHVFMFDVPQDPEYFVHRAGRTARAGKNGTNIVLTTPTEKTLLLRITRKFDIDIKACEIPSAEAVEEKMAEHATMMLQQRFRDKSNLERERLNQFVGMIEELVEEEPELLAMLVDEVYQKRNESLASEPMPEPKRSEDRRGGGGRNDKNKKRSSKQRHSRHR
ncbi:MAG: DEAD/DEAH box helicase [Bacteroidota bacterium]